ncbi:hypothetical protein CKO51_21120 [Rhodopirellula sp. SM50]|nr:hypothetical protein CKO51_21120 [Rhodopirellula sp. SM50]
MTKAWLTHQWVAAGIVSAASRFIPVPFVDDLVRSRCRRFVVSRTLAAYEQEAMLDDLKPFYDADRGLFSGAISQAAKVPLKLLLFPVRKAISIATSVRGVPLEVMRTVLLGRTLERYLKTEQLSGRVEQATRMNSAFEQSFKRMDFQVIKATISDTLSGVGGWQAAAMKSAKRVLESEDATAKEIESEPEVDIGANEVQAVLDRPETLQLFAQFDQRFDEAMAQSSN